MLSLALALALTQYPQHRLFKQPSLPTASYAFFEAFPASGAGTTIACSTTAPTGAKGEALTFTRTGSATCTRTATGGIATTGIADGDLVSLSGNVARVEYDSAGTLGLLVESSRTNVLLQSATISNAVYSDVATPTLTGSQTDPFGTTTAVQVDDNDGTAYEGRQQTVTVTAATAYIMSCFIKAGTTDKARLSLDGTGCNVSGLSATTWTRASCADASSSGAAIVAQVLVGNATSDTGTVIYGGCQVEAGTYMTSYQPAGAASAVRNAETATVSGVTLTSLASSGSASATITPAGNTVTTAGGVLVMASAGRPLYVSGVSVRTFDGTNERILSGGFVAGTGKRYWSSWSGSTLQVQNVTDATSQSGAFDGAMDTTGPLGVGYSAVLGSSADWIVSRLCIDPDPTRCR